MELEQPLSSPQTILFIVAHPDDIEFGAGGSAAVWSAQGHRVVYCIITNGAAGSNKPELQGAALIAQRQQEQTEAARIVGVQDVRFLGYADGMLQPTLELRRELTRLIRELKPYRVILMDPTTVLVHNEQFDYINHPDHRAAGEAALYAVFPSAESLPIFPELLDEGYAPHHVSEVYITLSQADNIAVDISDVIEQKIESLLAHKSQVDASVGEMIRGWGAEAGKQVDVAFAETFRVMRFLRDQPSEMVEAQPITETHD
jgi:LmbE family N-acetylglucosaminyl deacetylase